jgi:hypothetical protein
MFTFWFLVIPLIIGIVLIKKQRRINNCFYLEWETKISNAIEDQKKHLTNQFNKERDNFLSKEAELLASINYIKQEQDQKNKLFDLERETIREEYEKYKNTIQQELIFEKKRIITLNLLYQLKNIRIQKQIEARKVQVSYFDKKILRKQKQLKRLKRYYEQIKQNIIVLNDEVLYESFQLYNLRYDLENSEEYKEMLYKVRQVQKDTVKYNLAIDYDVTWSLDDNLIRSKNINKNNIKILIRSFNNECDVIIHKVKFNNVELAEKKIRIVREQLNKLNEYNSIMITDHYLELKLEELYLVYEHTQKLQEEKEEQKRVRELLREEKRAQEELNLRLQTIQKDEQHFRNALSKYQRQLKNAEIEERYNLEKQIDVLQEKLRVLQEEKEKVDYRIHHAKAGYVYIISNIGSFGENVFKIGMTRRLEPNDRVRELGDASVPFTFDIHAMIFSENAPLLERSLHNAFQDKRVNKINNRKEFFRVTLDEIKDVIHRNHNNVVKFTMSAEAQEYRESKLIEKDNELFNLNLS